MASAAGTATTPSNLDLLLDRLAQDTSSGRCALIDADELELITELRNDFVDLNRRHKARVALDRAKEIVADEMGCNLSESFRMIQRQASSKNKTIEQIVELILISDEMRRDRKGVLDGRSKSKRK